MGVKRFEAYHTYLDISWLGPDDDVIVHHDHNYLEYNFPRQLDLPIDSSRLKMLPDSWEYFFVEAGVSQTVKKLILIPKNASFVFITAKFKYKLYLRRDFHTAQKILKIDRGIL